MRILFTPSSRAIMAAYLLTALALPATVLAQAAYPNKAIQVIVPLQAGSAADVGTRVVLGKVGENMGASFAIENQPGASGLVGADRIARANPDGYLLGGITDSVLNYAVIQHRLGAGSQQQRRQKCVRVGDPSACTTAQARLRLRR